MSKRDRFTPTLAEVQEEQESAAWKSRRAALDRRFTDARTFLLMRHNFFGRLAMRLRYVWTERIPTMAVTADMTCYMSPDFVEKLNLGELAFLIAHEFCHIGYLHFDRIGNRDPDLWNCAGDYMINAMLVKAGLPMPVLDERWKDHPDYDRMVENARKAGHNYMGLLDKRFKDMSDVQIYEVLWEELKEKIRNGTCCPECGQETQQNQQQGGANQQGQQGQSGDQSQSGSQQGSQAGRQSDAGSDGQDAPGQGRGQGDQSQQHSGQGGQEGQEQDRKGRKKKGQGGGAQKDESGTQAQGGQGQDGEGQDSQSQSGRGQAGGAAGQQQGAGGHQRHSGTCKTCGQQKRQQGGWGTGRGDADFGATEQLKREAAQGRGGKVPTPGQIRDMLIAAASNTKALGRGSVPGEFERWIAELRDPQLPWQHILQRWVSSVLVSGQSYRRPSRSSATLVKAAQMRGLARGVRPILPGPKPDLQPVIIGVDVSGSRSEQDLRDDLSEVFSILERYPNPTRVIVWDAAVHFDDYVRTVDEIELRGGGGTATEPMFEAIEKDPGHYGPPAALIVFTDGMASYPDKAPSYPVLWAWTGKGDIPQTPPFGQVLTVEQVSNVMASYEHVGPQQPSAPRKRSRSR